MDKRISRRGFMAVCAAGAAAVVLPGTIARATLAADAPLEAAKPKLAPKKPLVVYFSRSGHTRKIADDIHSQIGGDIVEIEVVDAYPEDYQKTVDQAKQEQRDGARPAIKTKISNIGEYDVIFLGYPNWWGSMPMPVYTFIEEHKIDGKPIAPFMTHGGGGAGHSVQDLKKIAPHSKILKPLVVSGNAVDKAEKDVVSWLEGLGPALIETTTGNPQIYPDGAY